MDYHGTRAVQKNSLGAIVMSLTEGLFDLLEDLTHEKIIICFAEIQSLVKRQTPLKQMV